MPAGRPLELTRDIIKQAAQLLPRALYVETVADALGVHRKTFWKWVRDGSREHRHRERGREPDHKLSLQCELSNAVKKAIAETQIDFLGVIQAAGSESWQALAWVLERRFPERWATNRGELRALAKEIAALSRQGAGGGVPRKATKKIAKGGGAPRRPA